MADLAAESGHRPTRGWLSAGRLTCLALCLSILVGLPGCGGCGCRRAARPKTAEELEKERAELRAKLREKQKKKKKPDLQIDRIVSLPCEWKRRARDQTLTDCFSKPGHWTNAVLTAKANNFNIMGDLETAAIGPKGKPIGLPGMPFTMAGSRQVALPKGQPKDHLETVLFIPDTGKPASVATRIRARRGGGVYQGRYRVGQMPFYQYHFVVLARYPELYTYLKTLDSVKRPSELAFADPEQEQSYYRITLVETGRRTALPSHGLFCTSIAYVLWDDVSPDALSLDQQVAMLDWLHWGGQLILSGPETLDTLRDSFLADYLPAASTGARSLTRVDFEELNKVWTLPVGGRRGTPLEPVRSWSGIELEKHPQARFVPRTGNLLVQRRVGRGRIVASAFSLGEQELIDWKGFDGFFNGCLLGRPPRRFRGSPEEFEVTWAGDRGRMYDSRQKQYDTRLLCKLRYFSRDTGRKLAAHRTEDNVMAFGGYEIPEIVGLDVGSWSDFNAVATAARKSLQDAAGIEVPDRKFIVWVVGGYLLVLVPINWLVFHLLGRVEWAWAAAPVIAILCTMTVIRMAQLDIGFARSRNEIAVVEMQGDYSRAHVTRYSALYTSLTTKYDLHFEDAGTQVLPFPSGDNPEETGLLLGESARGIVYRYGTEVSLEDLRVQSSSTQMLHSEQMVDMGGSLVFVESSDGGTRVINRTGYTLHDAGVVRMTDSGQPEAAWLGTLEPEATVELQNRWRSVTTGTAGRLRTDKGPLWANLRNRSELTAAETAFGNLSLHDLVRLAENIRQMRPHDVRLVAWTDDEVPGMVVKPAAPQTQSVALVVAHLRYGPGEDPQPDKNTREEFAKERVRTVPISQ